MTDSLTALEDRAEAILVELLRAMGKGNSRRSGQVEMARAVARALTMRTPGLLEAGTGVGKSAAYIAGALAFGRQTVIAPTTKVLQDQLKGDLKFVRSLGGPGSALAAKPTTAVIKGKHNYLCAARLHHPDLADINKDTTVARDVAALAAWADQTSTGDRSEAPEHSEEAWNLVSVKSADCMGTECPFVEDCFAEFAKARAKRADLVVTNQFLLGTWLRYDLMPEAVAGIVVDEAHEFANQMGKAFGAETSTRQLGAAVGRARNLVGVTMPQRAEKALDALRGLRPGDDKDRAEIMDPVVQRVLTNLITAFKSLAADLLAEAGKTVAMISRSQLPIWKAVRKGDVTFDDACLSLLDAAKKLKARADELAVIRQGHDDTRVSWFERDADAVLEENALKLVTQRFDVSDLVADELLRPFGGVIFTSATLSVAGKFDHIARDLGVTDLPHFSGRVESPFNYRRGLLWMPAGLPDPSIAANDAEYTAGVIDIAEKAIRAAGGRTLILCTAKSRMRQIAQELDTRLGSEFSILVQPPSTSATAAVVKQFEADPWSVLVGTKSLATGMSVAGDTCAVVLIDRMPFRPGDPVLEARMTKAEERGGSGFKDVLRAEAIISLVQAVGRLIRSEHDRGLVIICDPRVHPSGPHSRGYATTVRRSLPPFGRAPSEAWAMQLLRYIDESSSDKRMGRAS